jgi:hypothetical protein
MTVALAALPGCGGATGEYCDLYCDCERCNDEEAELCGADIDYAAEVADIKGCSDDFDLYLECANESADCDDNDFTIGNDCENEAEDYFNCID